MKIPPVLIVLLCLGMNFASAQSILPCGTEYAHSNLILNSTHYIAEQADYEEKYRRHINDPTASSRNVMPYVFPVVVHVIHDCSPIGSQGNPTNRTIVSILDRTSQRFRHQHSGARTYANPHYGIDTEIEFCLAKLDPEGNYTSGIVRHPDQTHSRGLSATQAIYFSEQYSWDPTRYINIFIVEDTDVAGVYMGGRDQDFIIINASSFWDGLMTHELGHYFSLQHIFTPNAEETCTSNQDCLSEGDFVCDTPPKNKSGMNGGTCDTPANSCTSDENDTSENNPYRAVALGGLGDQPDMLSNYMDYTGNCWDAFTEGQKERMHFFIESQRMELVNNATLPCTAALPNHEVSIEQVDFIQEPCSKNWRTTLQIANNGTQEIASLTVNIVSNQNESYSFQPTISIAPGDTTTIELSEMELPIGENDIDISIAAPNGAADAFQNNNQYCLTVESTGEQGLATPYEASFSDCKMPPALRLKNSEMVSWETGAFNSEIQECHPCVAMVQAFSEEADTAELCLPNMDLRGFPEASLHFRFGYIPRYTFISNTLEIFASSECGKNDLIYSASGIDLATNIPPAYSPDESIQIPSCEEIKTVEIDLSAYIGKSNVSICFAAKGKWFSPLILDNIAIRSTKATQNEEENEKEEIEEEIDIEQQEEINSTCATVEYEQIIGTCEGQPVQGYWGPGIFKDTFQLANGCDSIRTLIINLTAERILTHMEKTICTGTSFEGHDTKGSYIDLFTANSGCDSVRILDLYIEEVENSTQQVVICEGDSYNGYTQQGTYIDTLFATSGCDSISITKLSIENCLSTNTFEIDAPARLTLFPNPASEQVYIRWQGEEELQYSVFSTTGKEMIRHQFLIKEQVIPISHFEKGLYLIHFQSSQGHFVKKLMIQ